jgi:hypothetical protein
VLILAGKTGKAARAFEESLDRFERKDNWVMAERVRRRLDELRAAPVVPG